MPSPEPLVSICIPVYNGGDLLWRALKSSVRQTYQNIEIVVVDNASTDSTRAVVEQYATRDSRVRYIRNEINIGPARNFLKSFESARGEYIQLLGHDDWLSLNYIAEGVRTFNQFPETAAVLPRTVSFSMDERGTLAFVNDVHLQVGNYTQAYIAKHAYRTPLGSIIMYALLRRTDIIEATAYTLELFKHHPVSVPQKFRELEEKGFGIDIVITSEIFRRHPFLTVTGNSAQMKLSNPGGSAAWAKREGAGNDTMSGIMVSYGYFRHCHEYVYAAHFNEFLEDMRLFVASETLVTILFNYIKLGFPKDFFDGGAEALRLFFMTYSVREKVALAARFFPGLVRRIFGFLARSLKPKKTLGEYQEYLDI